jgi:integrase
LGELTAVKVASLAKRTSGTYGDGLGLYLQVSPGGASWVFRYRVDGRLREMGLGPLHTISLAEARQKALQCRKMRLDGLDPIEERRASRAAGRVSAAKPIPSFKDCAEKCIAAHSAGWKGLKSEQQWHQTLADFAYPVFGSLPVDAIDIALILQVLEPIWETKTETASRLRGRIEAVLDWAKSRGYRQGENPARYKGHLENLLPRVRAPKVAHFAALPFTEIGGFMAELRQHEGISARALEFGILTAARSGEVLGARWGEFDLAERLWIVPEERTKVGREHRVPLSNAAIAILKAMAEIRQSDFVFPGRNLGTSLSHYTLGLILRRIRDEVTVHGFRSCFAQWAAERTNYSYEIRETALAHNVGSAIERSYQRSDLLDRRRRLMEDWADFCAGTAPASAQVVAIRA